MKNNKNQNNENKSNEEVSLSTREKKTYFFSERLIIRSKGIVATCFDEAEEKYLDEFKDQIKWGSFEVDSGDYEVYAVDKDGKQEKVY